MKSEKLTEYIHRPETIGTEALRELADLVSRYPYFQTARILYLKALYQKDSARFRNELKTGTVHITDHKQLYRYLNNQLRFGVTVSPAAGKNPLTEIVDERIREIQGHTVVNSFGIPAYPEEVQPPVATEEEMIRLNLQNPAEPSRPAEPVRRPQRRPLPKDHSPVISNPIQLDDIPGVVDDYGDSPESVETGFSPAIFPESQPYTTEITIPVTPPDSGEKTFVPEPPLPKSTVSRPASSLSMDLNLDDEPDEVPSTIPALPKGPILETPEIQSGAYRLNEPEIPAPVTPPVSRKTKKKKNELIDRFIQSEPSMPKIDPKAGDQRDLSKENPYGEEELFSETLAKIYVKQHLYEKAISTYIKLSLKYPEKSVYFAHRIEEIKENSINKE